MTCETYEQLIRLHIREALLPSRALEFFSEISGDHTIDRKLEEIQLITGVIIDTLDSGSPYAFPIRTFSATNLENRVTVPVDVYRSVLPIPWVVGYWVETKVFDDAEPAYQHLRDIGLNDDGLFYQIRPNTEL